MWYMFQTALKYTPTVVLKWLVYCTINVNFRTPLSDRLLLNDWPLDNTEKIYFSDDQPERRSRGFLTPKYCSRPYCHHAVCFHKPISELYYTVLQLHHDKLWTLTRLRWTCYSVTSKKNIEKSCLFFLTPDSLFLCNYNNVGRLRND